MAQAGFLNFDLFPYPSASECEQHLSGTGKRGILLVLSAATAKEEVNLEFLDSILKAAQLSPAATNTYRLDLSPGDTFALAACCHQRQITDVILFGDWRAALGIRAQLPHYSFIRLGGTHYLLAHDLDQLRREREQGHKQHAGALWQALKIRYL
jgi:hypothetical protein